MSKYILIIFIMLFTLNNIRSQTRWTQNYLEGQDPFACDIIEHYDNGYLLLGTFGPNYPSVNWLIKTDINGEIIWNKTIGSASTVVSFQEAESMPDGSVIIAGGTYYYGVNNSDPLIMKIDSCGEKEWCKVFIEDGNNVSYAVEITPDKEIVILLRYMNPDYISDRICLAKLSNNGDLVWKKCYNSNDPYIHNPDAMDLTICPDNGFLITGLCDYRDPEPPHYYWIKPYYIKTDSLGNFEWETIIHKESKNPGGIAYSTVINPDSNYFYSSLSHYYYDPYQDAPAIAKIDLQGNVIDIYNVAEPNEIGKLVEAKFISDTTLMANASWGYESDPSPKAIIIDTLGNMINSSVLLDNIWMAETEVTFDKKLLYLTNDVDQNDNFSTYLFKLDQQLESDTIYTGQFNYDSLCPYQIVSDTIVQNNCGLIVGNEEIYYNSNESTSRLLIYPNPARESFTIEIDNYQANESIIYIYDIHGKMITNSTIAKNENLTQINVKDWKKGLYIIKLYDKNGTVAYGKVMIQ